MQRTKLFVLFLLLLKVLLVETRFICKEPPVFPIAEPAMAATHKEHSSVRSPSWSFVSTSGFHFQTEYRRPKISNYCHPSTILSLSRVQTSWSRWLTLSCFFFLPNFTNPTTLVLFPMVLFATLVGICRTTLSLRGGAKLCYIFFI